ncbi:MAG TPA: single-stranded DNA-binding protein, partial [Candidatus Sulfotelmatobacter sp.]|nr:single-stranded DNA-binding protein [Candidatus Sulfotelmatobacter sp.]
TLATDSTYKDRSGERQKKTEWHRIVVWSKLAEICQQYLKKGSLIYIEGRLQTREWEDKSGQKRSTTEVVASEMRMLGSRGDSAAAGAGASHGAEPDVMPAEDTGGHEASISDEDIPF